MKKYILLAAMSLIMARCFGQQCTTLSKSCSYEEDPIGLLGSGNLNSVSLENANASGKITAYVRLLEKYKEAGAKKDQNLTFYISFTKNVTGNDTLALKSLLYPDLGNNAFQGTLEYSILLSSKENSGPKHYLAPFAEGWIKDYKINDTDSTEKQFTTINGSIGLRYIFHFTKKEGEGEEIKESHAFFSAAAYFTHNSVLKKDVDDFNSLTSTAENGTIPRHYKSLGLKLALEYNKFQFYIDMRNTLGKDDTIPREIRGFSYNIGIVTTAAVLGID